MNGDVREDGSEKTGLWHWTSLDHYDPQVNRAFRQRYWINDTYFKEDGPVFLCVGGEGPPLDESVLVDSIHCSDMVQLGRAQGALLLALEHRFYGKSLPFPDFETSNLRYGTPESPVHHVCIAQTWWPNTRRDRYLSSEQALGDLAGFHSAMTRKYKLSDATRWIVWGGSYPGMLASFARGKLPHLFFGAVASSAPVRAKADFFEVRVTH
jgi:hypothetical protein